MMDRGHWQRTEVPGLAERISKGIWPLGVFCANDSYARFVVGSCFSNDIEMPEQVAVVGVNNSEVSDGLAEIPFSSVELQLEKIGYAAMELLSSWIENKKRPDEPALIPPKRVVVRLSSDLIAVKDEAVARALRLIREGALGPIEIRDVVRNIGVSRRILEKRFKDATGRTPYAEVLRLRVDKAKSLLAGTDLRISEVAEKCGFSNGKQLHIIFTRHTAMPPTAYRKKFQTPR
jgi:LacI family transcriptional regulator